MESQIGHKIGTLSKKGQRTNFDSRMTFFQMSMKLPALCSADLNQNEVNRGGGAEGAAAGQQGGLCRQLHLLHLSVAEDFFLHNSK